MAEYIERKVLKEKLRKRVKSELIRSWLCGIINEVHAVDVKPVVNGHWVSLTDCSNAGVYCSNCHKKVYKEDYALSNRKNKLRSNYCPNCGADMREKEE